ncbi:hypothetical protein CEUSTIGMA_g9811.t1 [Chlamydomonas eustigma]|uniref:Uncharacterized protein n=1 Tax=Chlamydomonas eustigma TaxID=1157962 RepID=A0A250XH58_9CHLO|nr:hypothetical protein CEUSTIGMA_g9811.t1 [Chlamydomonas eustigma]|eukprot:GAX82383.1 hypothetical protein CEUSTIGMA_g9811.t1 [Chlamydomonas eustigma]
MSSLIKSAQMKYDDELLEVKLKNSYDPKQDFHGGVITIVDDEIYCCEEADSQYHKGTLLRPPSSMFLEAEKQQASSCCFDEAEVAAAEGHHTASNRGLLLSEQEPAEVIEPAVQVLKLWEDEPYDVCNNHDDDTQPHMMDEAGCSHDDDCGLISDAGPEVENHDQAGYLGFLARHFTMPTSTLSLQLYLQKRYFLAFVAFLFARKVQRDHIVKHMTICRGVHEYFSTRSEGYGLLSSNSSRATTASSTTVLWLDNLQKQVKASCPKHDPMTPDGLQVYEHVEALSKRGLSILENEMQSHNRLSKKSAMTIQVAILANLVTGFSMPPGRLHVLKTLKHPSHVESGGCQDPDCLNPDNCKGNHIEEKVILNQHGEEQHTLIYRAIHHKNDRRHFQPLETNIPQGTLTKLLQAHISHGHKLLAAVGESSLFVSGSGAAFNDVTFVHFWRTHVLKFAPFPYFPPSAARRMFVSAYTAVNGPESGLWDGAAIAMGSSTKMWVNHYGRAVIRRRLAQFAVDRHASSFKDRILDPNDEEEYDV